MLWVEIKNTLPMNNENLQSNETTDCITNETENESNEIECEDMKQVWKRNCPKCNTSIHYKNKKCLNKSTKKNQLCRKCSRDGIVFGPMSNEHKDKIRRSNLKNGVGKWMVGRTLSDTVKQKISKSNIGKKLSEKTKQKMSILKMGDKNPAKRQEIREKISKTRLENPREITQETRRLLSVKAKVAMFDRIEKLGIVPRPNYNPIACDYFEELNRKNGWDLTHAMNGGETRILCYYLDAYDCNRNIVVEYDEPRHYDVKGNLKQKDVIRMNEIINKTGSQFYRYNQKTDEFRLYNPSSIIDSMPL